MTKKYIEGKVNIKLLIIGFILTITVSVASEIDYSCTMIKRINNGENVDIGKHESEIIKFQVKTTWYKKPIGITLFENGIKKRVVKNVQEEFEYFKDDKMIFKDENFNIVMTKGEFSSLIVNASDSNLSAEVHFNCLKD